MLRNRLVLVCMLVTLTLPVSSHGQGSATGSDKAVNKSGPAKVVKSEAGLNIPEWGIAIDAVYDDRLDGLIPEYNILNVVISNRRETAIELDVNKDKWTLVDSRDRKHNAYNHVSSFNKKLWDNLPSRMKKMLDYPLAVKPGNSVMIDLFFPKSVSLNQFKEVTFKSAALNGVFTIFTTGEHLAQSLPSVKEIKIPDSQSSMKWSQKGDLEKYVEDKLMSDDSLEPAKEKIYSSDPASENFDKFKSPTPSDENSEKDHRKINFDPSFDDSIILR